MLSHLSHVVRRAWRLQHRTPAATALIVATLAVGIAADVTVFSILDPILLQPLPFDRPEQIRVISSAFPRMNLAAMGLSGPEALELPQFTRALAAVGAVTFSTVTVQSGDGVVRGSAAFASAAALDVLRPRLTAGRVFTSDDQRAGSLPVALLGEAFWRRAFGADRGVVGRVVTIDGRQTTLVGVLAPRVDLMNRQIEIWQPLGLTRDTAGSRADHRYTVLARVKDGVGDAAAAADLAAAVAGWQRATGEFHSPAPDFHPLESRALMDVTRGPVIPPLRALAAAVVLVLLIACANAASLMLARAEARRAQAAVEIALGAGFRHLASLYVVEALLLSATAAVSGVGLAALAIRSLKAFGPALVRPDDIAIDGRVLAFTAAIALLTSVIVAVAPVLRLDVARAYRWLQAGGRGAMGASDRTRLHQSLVATQIAVAVALAVGGIVTVRSLMALTSIDPGYRPSEVMRALISLPLFPYATDDERTWHFYEELLDRVSALPSVHAAAVMSGVPPVRPANNTTFMLDGATAFDHTSMPPQVDFVQHVSPAYFSAMGVRVQEGRAFAAGDSTSGAPVAIVNETLAKRFWPRRSALGRRLRPAISGVPWFTVIGVVADVHQAGLQAAPGGEVYVPYRQGRMLLPGFLPRAMNLVARGPNDPSILVASVQQIARELEPAAAVSGGGTLQDVVDRAIAQPRLLSWLLTTFAAIALMLAAVGVYGVTSATVAARTAEFGVRVALGATSNDVVRQVLRTSAPPVLIGAVAGCAVSFAAVRYLAALLFGVERWSGDSIGWAAALLGLVALAAAFIPALRAARLDPIEALRSN